MLLSKNKRRDFGFTLIELLVTISIITLISSLVLASLGQARVKARDSKRVQDLLEVQKALELYYAKYGQYPGDPADFNGGVQNNKGVSCWQCPDDPGINQYDPLRLIKIEEFLNPRPCDPLLPCDQQYIQQTGISRGKGFQYKVNNVNKKCTEYKLAIGRVIENPSNVPARLLDPYYIPGDNNTISVWSSEISRIWSRDNDFVNLGKDCDGN